MDENLIGENILFGKEFEDLLLNRDQVDFKLFIFEFLNFSNINKRKKKILT